MPNDSTIAKQSLVIITTLLLFFVANSAFATRFVNATIAIDGQVILEDSTGDNGSVSDDDVWQYLKSFTFKPTEAFRALHVPPDAKEVLLISCDHAEIGRINVTITYGGTARTQILRLTRVPVDEYGKEWVLDKIQVDKMSSDRLKSSQDQISTKLVETSPSRIKIRRYELNAQPEEPDHKNSAYLYLLVDYDVPFKFDPRGNLPLDGFSEMQMFATSVKGKVSKTTIKRVALEIFIGVPESISNRGATENLGQEMDIKITSVVELGETNTFSLGNNVMLDVTVH